MFFFSSRRRHTRCSRDWSSDVCSSDLGTGVTELKLSPPSETFRTFPTSSRSIWMKAGSVGTFRKNRSEEHTSELQSRLHLVCRLLLEKKKKKQTGTRRYASTKLSCVH